VSDDRWPGATPPAAELLDQAAPDRAPHMRAFLAAAVALGSVTDAQESVRTDYVNIYRPARSAGRGRLASLHVRTGRVEFQGNSWDAAVRTGLAGQFDQLAAGNKAAISLLGPDQVEAATAVARAVLAGRTG
jgi:hypothetical protein